MRRHLLIRRFATSWLLGVFTALLWMPATARIPELRPTPDHPRVVAGLSTADWNSIRQEYERNRHAAFPVPGGYQARNHRLQWRIQFDGRGFEVQPDSAEWTWGLQLESYGRPDKQVELTGAPQVKVEKERIQYEWSSGLHEWWVNDQQGLEHGFTIAEPPTPDGEGLVLRLKVRGGLLPRVLEDGGGASFVDGSDQTVVNYTGLKVWDADGRTVTARMQALGEVVEVEVDDRSARYPLTIDPIAQQAYLKASNSDRADGFGHSVAVSGETVVVGAFFEDSNARGVNGNQNDNSWQGDFDSGAAYVFVRNAGIWTQQAYLKASNTDGRDSFGWSVSVSGDTVVVGAYTEDSSATGVNGDQGDNSAEDSGAAYVFVRDAGSWTQQAYLKASNIGEFYNFGWSVAVSGDTVVVGAANEGGRPSLSSGAAYVFVRNGAVWTQQAYLKSSNTGGLDHLGASVAVAGDTVVVGAPGEDSNATGVNGNQSDNSGVNSGAAYVFVRDAGTWTQQAYLKASNSKRGDWFGYSVAVSGDTVVVGNRPLYYGAAYVFVRNAGVWTQQAFLKASNSAVQDFSGRSVAVSGHTVVVGAVIDASNATGVNGNQSDNSAPFSGAAYVFVRNGAVWTQQAYLKASNTGEGDAFGGSVAVSGDTVVVGAPGEASNATGVNGNQSDNSSQGAGAAYVFSLDTADTPGDVSGDGSVNCADLALIRASFGKRAGQPGWDARADVITDGSIDVRDLAFVSQKVPAGTRCQ